MRGFGDVKMLYGGACGLLTDGFRGGNHAGSYGYGGGKVRGHFILGLESRNRIFAFGVYGEAIHAYFYTGIFR